MLIKVLVNVFAFSSFGLCDLSVFFLELLVLTIVLTRDLLKLSLDYFSFHVAILVFERLIVVELSVCLRVRRSNIDFFRERYDFILEQSIQALCSLIER